MTKDDIRTSAYAPFLEDLVRGIMEDGPQSVGALALFDDGRYGISHHNSGTRDLAVMAFYLLAEALRPAILDTVLDNIDLVQSALGGEDPRDAPPDEPTDTEKNADGEPDG